MNSILIKTIEAAASQYRDRMAEFGHEPDVMEVAQHVWHAMGTEDQDAIKQHAPEAAPLHSQYQRCLELVAECAGD